MNTEVTHSAERPLGALLDTHHRTPTTQRAWRLVLRNPIGALGGVIVALVILVALFANVLAPYDPVAQLAQPLEPASAAHLLGSDEFGRDVLSRVIHGARVSLYVGIISVGIALISGSILGLMAGYYGGRIDMLIMRLMDILFGLPAIVLAIAITSVLGPSLNSVLIAIGIVYAPQFSRVARAPTLSLRERDFVTAARALGAGPARVILRHVLPNAAAPIIVSATLGVGNVDRGDDPGVPGHPALQRSRGRHGHAALELLPLLGDFEELAGRGGVELPRGDVGGVAGVLHGQRVGAVLHLPRELPGPPGQAAEGDGDDQEGEEDVPGAGRALTSRESCSQPRQDSLEHVPQALRLCVRIR